MLINIRDGIRAVRYLLLHTGLAIGSLGYAGSAIASVGGTPAYQVESVPFQWIDATVAPTAARVPIGFDFDFYGISHNSLVVSGAGYLTFAADPSVNNDIISPFRSYYYPSPNQAIYTLTDGVAPNRRFTVSWINLAYATYVEPDCGCSPDPFGSVSFQVTLYEGSNDIVFRYLDTVANDEGPYQQPVDNGNVAWVGLVNPDGSGGTLYSNNQPVIFGGTAMRLFKGKNLSPVVNAGADQVVTEGTNVTLNGDNSSDNGTITTYTWAQYRPFPYTYPYAPIVTLDTPNAAVAHFVAPQLTSEPSPTTLDFQLTVMDNERAYTIDKVKIDVLDLNTYPTVDAGPDITVDAGAAVALRATANDPNGTIVTYRWYQSGGATSVALTDATTAILRFTAPANNDTLTFVVTAFDNEGASATDIVMVAVRAANTVPVANAGPDQIAKQKTTVTLNGSSSYDPDGRIVSYKWRQVAGKPVALNNATSAKATFTAPSTNSPISLTFELTVTDDRGATATDRVVVMVTKR